MKKNILSLTAFAMMNFCFGQAILEHSYENPNSISSDDVFFAFNAENGINYFTFTYDTNTFTIYDESHTQTNTFTVPGLTEIYIDRIIVTDKLFNNDSNFEFLLMTNNNYIIVVKDDGTLIQEFNNRNFAKIFKNNSGEYKLVVKAVFPDIVDVYSLPGTLSTNQQDLLLNRFIAFPNPTSNKIFISNPLLDGQKYNLEVFDLSGKKVMQMQINNSNEISLDVSNLSSGTYIYKINNYTNKFIKR